MFQAKTTIGLERDKLLESASEMIENDFILLGAVAIEDRLQKGVIFFLVFFPIHKKVLQVIKSTLHLQFDTFTVLIQDL